jgi:hypothetical protein
LEFVVVLSTVEDGDMVFTTAAGQFFAITISRSGFFFQDRSDACEFKIELDARKVRFVSQSIQLVKSRFFWYFFLPWKRVEMAFFCRNGRPHQSFQSSADLLKFFSDPEQPIPE